MATSLEQNRLADETSPYLRQHGANPVHWQPWTPEVLAQARALDRPILLSVGYAACHWCHVMAHECFEDPDTARLMNQHFVNIKVDREERPDLDTIYQSALALMGSQGGWPLTMFLTPQGEPFWGGTYFPREPAYGRPGFKQILRQLGELWSQDPEQMTSSAAALVAALQGNNTSEDADLLPHNILNLAADALLPHMDAQHGGLKGAPKFPQTTLLDLFSIAHHKTDKTNTQYTVDFTLTSLCQGGIYDHVGGGFSRYSTDARWLAPHFEKMLYDNAMILKSLTESWRHNRSKLFAARISETITWLLQDMTLEGGAFTSSYDADSEGAEGKYYTWDCDELERLLGNDFANFASHYDVTPGGNWEGVTILNRLNARDWAGGPQEQKLQDNLATLRAVRSKRIKPEWDDKVLADWNGLTITALSEAAIAFSNPTWLDAAQKAFDFVATHLSDGQELYHVWAKARAHIPAFSDDYANMANAALTLYEATGEPNYLTRAEAWVDVLQENFLDRDRGGYFFTHAASTDLIQRTRQATDHPLPAANGTLGAVLSKLFHLTGDTKYRDAARELFAAFAGSARREPLGHATLLTSFDFSLGASQIILVGEPAHAATQSLLREVFQAPVRHRILHQVPDTQGLPAGHPAHGKKALGGRPTLYLCRGQTCSAAITEPSKVRALITT